jgi:hypothetical protein
MSNLKINAVNNVKNVSSAECIKYTHFFSAEF